jgi:hypothetical protein
VRLSSYYPLGVLAAALLASCSSDPAAPTAPTTPSFSQSSPLILGHLYRFTLTCTDAASEHSFVVIRTDRLSGLPDQFQVRCGEGLVAPNQGFVSFSYSIVLQGAFISKLCEDTDVNTVGPFKCRKGNQYSATLMLIDLGLI